MTIYSLVIVQDPTKDYINNIKMGLIANISRGKTSLNCEHFCFGFEMWREENLFTEDLPASPKFHQIVWFDANMARL